jgi:uncharacterized protein
VTAYLDTSALFAALVRSDRGHAQAGPVLAALLERSIPLVTTSYVLLETLALLQSRVGIDAARRFERALRPRVEVVWVDDDLHARAFERLDRLGRRAVSLVDCAGFVVMEERGIRHAFALDEHFREEGFVLLSAPAAIPEAG